MRQTANATIIDKILNNNVYPAMFQVSHLIVLSPYWFARLYAILFSRKSSAHIKQY